MRLGRWSVMVGLLVVASRAYGGSVQVLSVNRDVISSVYATGFIVDGGITLAESERISTTEPLPQFEKKLSTSVFVNFLETEGYDISLWSEAVAYQKSQFVEGANQVQIEASGYILSDLIQTSAGPIPGHAYLEQYGDALVGFGMTFDVLAPVYYDFDVEVPIPDPKYHQNHIESFVWLEDRQGFSVGTSRGTHQSSGILQPGRYSVSLWHGVIHTWSAGPQAYRMKLSLVDVAAVPLPASAWAGGAMMGALALAKGFRRLRRA